MKRFLVFAGEHYYPAGGMNDLMDSFDSMDEALSFAKIYQDDDGYEPKRWKPKDKDYPLAFAWWHVVDSSTMEIVAAFPEDDDEEQEDE